MKKRIIVFLVFLSILSLGKHASNVLIPKDAIRFRVIANSDTKEDQEIKKEISKTIQQDLYPKLLEKKDKEDAKEFLVNYQEEVSKKVEDVMKKNQVETTYKVDYGDHYFPKKIYKGVEYPEGNYESLVITLGNAKGKNWWCVLFPPLCLLEAEEEEEIDEVQYKSFVKELLEKYFK